MKRLYAIFLLGINLLLHAGEKKVDYKKTIQDMRTTLAIRETFGTQKRNPNYLQEIAKNNDKTQAFLQIIPALTEAIKEINENLAVKNSNGVYLKANQRDDPYVGIRHHNSEEQANYRKLLDATNTFMRIAISPELHEEEMRDAENKLSSSAQRQGTLQSQKDNLTKQHKKTLLFALPTMFIFGGLSGYFLNWYIRRRSQ